MDTKTKIGPFMKSNDNISKMMKRLLISLLPIIIFSFYKNGILLYVKGYTNFFGMFYPLIFIILGTMSSLITEEAIIYIFKKKRGKELIESVMDSYAIFPGLFLSLILPLNTPLAVLFIGGIFATIIGKMVYGGFGQNLFNPALVGALFVIICYGSLINTNGGYANKYELDMYSNVTPLTNIKLVEDVTYDNAVRPYGNLLNFFIGNIPGALGVTSSLLIIIAFVYLTITKTIKWRISISYVTTFMIMSLIYSYITGIGYWYHLFSILSGGILFGSVFMATDPVTSPITTKGQILYGMALGFMTFLIRMLTNIEEDIILSILFMNALVLFFDKIGSRIEYNKKYYLFYLIMILAIIGSSIYIGKTNVKNIDDIDFKILNKENIDGNTTYEVLQKGFGGNIKAKITFDSRNMKSIEILDHYETNNNWNIIEKNKYLETLYKKQSDLNNVDTISGATITSEALKKMISNTIEDYIKGNDITITNPTIEVISKEANRDALVYMVKLDSYGGEMEIQIVAKGNTIRTAIPVIFNDTCIRETKKSTYYECPEYLEDSYIKNLIINQDNLSNVDTVSGATISSKALKEVFIYMKEKGLR